jgi:hypothetical protein
MNSDIIYEILKCLYISPEENSGDNLATKLKISLKFNQTLLDVKFEKPLVFEVNTGYIHLGHKLGSDCVIYWGDGSIIHTRHQLGEKIKHHYSDCRKYVIKIFGKIDKVALPMNHGIKIYYIFELGYISYECAPIRIEKSISKLPVISMPHGTSPEIEYIVN